MPDVVAYTCGPRTWEGKGREIPSSRPAWASQYDTAKGQDSRKEKEMGRGWKSRGEGVCGVQAPVD